LCSAGCRNDNGNTAFVCWVNYSFVVHVRLLEN
jgi:hypothetical protein